MGDTKTWAIFAVLFSTILNSFAQVFYKYGANRLSFSVAALITNYPLMIGISIYGVSALILLVSLRGGELSVLYPLIATSYIWVSISSVYFFGEVMNLYKWLGIFTIILGVSLIGLGSRK